MGRKGISVKEVMDAISCRIAAFHCRYTRLFEYWYCNTCNAFSKKESFSSKIMLTNAFGCMKSSLVLYKFDLKEKQMKTKLLIVLIMALGIAACNKDKFNTTPGLTFTDVNTTQLSPNQSIVFTLHYTDKEGDIQSTLYVQKITKNCEASNFESLYAIPAEVPKQTNAEGDIQVRFGYGVGLGFPAIKEPACPGQNDTCVFRFALTDLANNTSDTITSPQIVLIKR